MRNLVAAVTNSYANRVISAFDYTNDAAGRRTAISRSGEAFGDLSGATDSYGYNSRNEVISARRTKNGEIIHGFNEDFEYDPIGNRIWSTTYNELGEPKTSQYIANNLNQYTSRTVPGYAAVRGHTDAGATVTVNEKPTYRYGEYFFGSDEFDNSQFAVEAELITSAVLASPTNGPDEVCSVTSRVHIPKATQHFTYDLDGNFSTDGYYTFTYDSDNRLEKVSTNGVLVLTNFYDEKSRCVKKVTADAVITFFYDDWNLVEERIAYTNGAMTTIHYCWGTDLSGTLHGAGGVGGLLYLTVDDEIYIPCYDNNGNITQYIDVNGYSVASYAYDSFGGIIAKSGPLADLFRHRFSTKYFDAETALYYYGYRFYNPDYARWLNRDPIGEDGGLNLYGFCGNNSLFNVDILGNEIYKSITFKRLHAQKINALKSVFISDFPNGDYYGHWWVEFDGESYGWWPLRPVGLYDTLKGVPGEVNGRTSFSGTETKDPHHGDSANETFHPRRKSSGMMQHGQAKGQKCKCTNEDDAKDCLRSFASSYSGNWSYPGNSCHTFQLKSMTDCCLSR